MSDRISIDVTLLSSYLDGECSADERVLVEHWAAESSRNLEILEELKIMWSSLVSRPKHSVNIRALHSALEVHVSSRSQSADRQRAALSQSDNRRSWITRSGYAAGLALVLLIGFKGVQMFKGNAIQPDINSREYVTRRAERMDVTLPDGSRAILAPETRLRFVAEGNKGRNIELDGQAYFSVKHSAAQTFTVRAANSMTQVLGTSFVVRAHHTDRMVQVVVADGKVSVGTGNQSAILSAGDVGQVARTGHSKVTVAHTSDIDAMLGWTRGELVFNDTPFQEVAYELERLYDIDIRIADSALASRTVKIKFTGKSATDMLAVLGVTLDAQVERTGRNVVFRLRK